MLNFYINRGGENLSATEKKRLEKTKDACGTNLEGINNDHQKSEGRLSSFIS